MSIENIRHMIDLRNQANADLEEAMAEEFPIGCKVLIRLKCDQKELSKGEICGYEAHTDTFLIRLEKKMVSRKYPFSKSPPSQTVKRLTLRYIERDLNANV